MDKYLADKIAACLVALGSMRWFIMAHCFSLLLQFVLLRRQSDQAKDLQILLLRRQLEIVQRKLDKPLRVSHAEKFSLALLTLQLKHITGQSVRNYATCSASFSPKLSSNGIVNWFAENGRIGIERAVDVQEPCMVKNSV